MVGRNVALIIHRPNTVNCSRRADRTTRGKALSNADFPQLMAAGSTGKSSTRREYNGGGRPSRFISAPRGDPTLADNEAGETISADAERTWFPGTPGPRRATWKMEDLRVTPKAHSIPVDPQKPATGPQPKPWPGAGLRRVGREEEITAAPPRTAEIYDCRRDHVSHGRSRPPSTATAQFLGAWPRDEASAAATVRAVGIVFITGSISAPGLVESLGAQIPAVHR